MKTKITTFRSILITACLLIVTGFSNWVNAQCNPYISQTPTMLRFAVTLTGSQAFVEVFATKNGQQNIAQNITGSAFNNGNGTYTYSYETPLGNYTTGDAVQARFYSYLPAQPGVFTPGPSEGNWSPTFLINISNNCNPPQPQASCEYDDAGTMKLFIQQDGSVKFMITFNQAQAYVELFAKKDGLQNIATNIVGSQVLNMNSTYSYSYITATNAYTQGNVITYRFYSYVAAQPAVFNPGPGENAWSQPVTYTPCINAVYVSMNGNDLNPGTKAAPVRNSNKGIAIAIANTATEVHVAQGLYTEAAGYANFFNMIEIANGISLIGGYTNDFNSAPDPAHLTEIRGPNGSSPGSFYPRVIEAVNITNSTVIANFTIENGASYIQGGGVFVNNSNSNLVLHHNTIENNYTNYGGMGGNVSVLNSSAQIYNNQIVFGTSSSFAGDLQVSGTYTGGFKSDIHHNLFTCNTPTYIQGTAFANFHDNSFLCGPAPAPAPLQEKVPVINTAENNIQISNLDNSPFSVDVYDVVGQLLLHTNNVSFSLNEFVPGAYTISVTQGEQRVSKMTIVR